MTVPRAAVAHTLPEEDGGSEEFGVREYRVLGPLEMRRGRVPVDLGPPKQRAVLGALLLARGRVVTVDRLADTLWGEQPPVAATTSLQAYISNLRRALRNSGEASPIERVGAGYRIDLGTDVLDVAEFAELARSARIARDEGRWADALADSAAALDRWRGDLLGGELDDVDWVAAESAALDENLMATQEIHISALMAEGDIGGALGAIVTLRSREPLRDRGVWLHMAALYRAGRATEALEVYAEHQRVLDIELGLVPGSELVDLHGAILRHDPVIAAWPRPPHWSGAVTVTGPAGLEESVSGQSVLGTGGEEGAASNAPMSGSIAREVPLVGRSAEIERIRTVFGAPGSPTRWLLLGGPPGIGKTRLAEEAARIGAETGSEVVWVRCPDAEGVPAWWPMRQLCRALGVDPAGVLSVPDGVDADTARFAVYDRVQTMLEQAASNQGLTVVVDDAQWADAMTLGLLTYLTTVLRDVPIALIVTARDGEGGHDLQRLRTAVARVGGVGIDIPTLGRSGVADLVRAVAAQDADAGELDADALDTLMRRTGGNPLFVTEFSRLPAAQRRSEAVPAAIRSVLDRRLATLDPAVLDVLGHAAVLGETIDAGLLATVMDRDVGDLADRIDEAIDERILVAAGGSARFAHALLREQALAGIRPLRRARLHLRVAEILSRRHTAGSTSRRAAHLLEALPVADPADVVAACRAAADEATAQWDSESAAHWLGAALRTHESAGLADREERDDLLIGMLAAQARAGHVETVLDGVGQRMQQAITEGATATVGRLASALIRAGGSWPWVGPHVDNETLQTLLDRAEIAVAADPSASARVVAASAIGQCYHKDASVPAGLLARADALATDLGDDDITADVWMARLITYSGVAEYAESSLALAERLRALPHTDQAVDEVIIDTALTMATMTLGDVDGTAALVRTAIVGSERLRLPILRAQLRWMEASLAVWHGDFATATHHFRTAVTVHQMTELYVAGTGTIALLALAAERGMLDDLADTGDRTPMEWARMIAADFTDDQVAILLAAGIAMIAGAEGDRELAEQMIVSWLADDRPMIWTSLCQAVLLAHVVVDLELVEHAARFADYLTPYRWCIATLGQLGCIGPVGLALARVCFLLGRVEEGEAALAAARELSEREGGVPSVLRCRLLAAQRSPRSARRDAELAEIAETASRLEVTQVEAAARELLGESDSPR
ncbi:BTAD domain-containing putative transcriptional regulator [Gordonia sp. L191]|uniref:BTAD domain-containing putative transcriptional regulator n=1 Tax=Gordonia sp. L191 TaxID=2982699 RepID=UPI0024BFDC4F|nr:BTAD domain-containing putative transcriptional regulator [Gordonia sp. L191]WHU48805.1 BTAD domain-containing putative transcriptional regulator [Gordonia sp. L191]